MEDNSKHQFKVLLSKFKRHDLACPSLKIKDTAYDLSNVSYFPSYIEIELMNGEVLKLTGAKLKISDIELSLEDLCSASWGVKRKIQPTTSSLQKSKIFDQIQLETIDNSILLTGLGQSVFPTFSYLQWVISRQKAKLSLN